MLIAQRIYSKETPMTQILPMATFTGQRIYFLEPERTAIYGEDLYQHLKNQCRYQGAIPVSILAHLALCVRLAELYKFTTEEVAYCAAHDLHETYVGDMVAPMKQVLPEFGERIEERWEEHVHHFIGLQYPLHTELAQKVRFIDLRALVVETDYFNFTSKDLLTHLVGKGMTQEERKVAKGVFVSSEESQWSAVLLALIEGNASVLHA